MSQSSLVDVKMLTSHYGYPDGKKGRGGAKIDKIFVHHMAGILSAEQCGKVFKSRQASAHYGVDSKGRVGQYVLEENTAWHCASRSYNQRCIDLIADICVRNGISKINYTGDLKGNLCMHCWTASTSCPGPYLKKQFKRIANGVNQKLGGSEPTPAPAPAPAPKPKKDELYRVRKSWGNSKSQVGAFKVLANAKKAADKKGYNVYDSSGALVYHGKRR